jgi:hypothetical protein
MFEYAARRNLVAAHWIETINRASSFALELAGRMRVNPEEEASLQLGSRYLVWDFAATGSTVTWAPSRPLGSREPFQEVFVVLCGIEGVEDTESDGLTLRTV